MDHDVLGLRLDYSPPETYLPRIIHEAALGRPAFCCISNVHQCILVHDDKTFQDCTDRAFLNIPDSAILQRARSFLYGVPMIETLKGADIMSAVCQLCADQNISIGLFGGKDEDVLMQLERSLKAVLPHLNIGYSYSPPFRALDAVEARAIQSDILASGIKVLFVGLGCPKQERWMGENSPALPVLMLGVGAAFDFLSGRVTPSPPWVHRYGLEWLYRLTREPARLWRRYLTTSPKFIGLVLLTKLGIRRTRLDLDRSLKSNARTHPL